MFYFALAAGGVLILWCAGTCLSPESLAWGVASGKTRLSRLIRRLGGAAHPVEFLIDENGRKVTDPAVASLRWKEEGDSIIVRGAGEKLPCRSAVRRSSAAILGPQIGYIEGGVSKTMDLDLVVNPSSLMFVGNLLFSQAQIKHLLGRSGARPDHGTTCAVTYFDETASLHEVRDGASLRVKPDSCEMIGWAPGSSSDSKCN